MSIDTNRFARTIAVAVPFRAHRPNHTGEREHPFACSDCGKCFISQAIFRGIAASTKANAHSPAPTAASAVPNPTLSQRIAVAYTQPTGCSLALLARSVSTNATVSKRIVSSIEAREEHFAELMTADDDGAQHAALDDYADESAPANNNSSLIDPAESHQLAADASAHGQAIRHMEHNVEQFGHYSNDFTAQLVHALDELSRARHQMLKEREALLLRSSETTTGDDDELDRLRAATKQARSNARAARLQRLPTDWRTSSTVSERLRVIIDALDTQRHLVDTQLRALTTHNPQLLHELQQHEQDTLTRELRQFELDEKQALRRSQHDEFEATLTRERDRHRDKLVELAAELGTTTKALRDKQRKLTHMREALATDMLRRQQTPSSGVANMAPDSDMPVRSNRPPLASATDVDKETVPHNLEPVTTGDGAELGPPNASPTLEQTIVDNKTHGPVQHGPVARQGDKATQAKKLNAKS